MPTGATGQLGLALPVQGELSGTWGNTVNNAITEYTNIAIAATLTLTNDGAVTLANTTGTDLATNITSSLTGAGTVTAQFAIVRVTGTLTTTKVVTFGSGGSAPYSKTYLVVNAATGGSVSFTAFGGTGVTIAVGESAYVYFNGTNIVKVSSTVDTGVTSFTAGTTGFTPSSATTGAVTLAGTLATTNGGTGLTSFTSGGVVYASSSSALATGSALTFDGTSLSTTGQILLNNNNYVGFKNTSGTAAVSIFNDTSNFLNLYNSGNTGTIFYVNAAEQMRLTSTGLGIGTSSPSVKLDVNGTNGIGRFNSSDANGVYVTFANNGTAKGYIGSAINIITSGSANDFAIQAVNNFVFATGGAAERMRITSAGDVLIGTTSNTNSAKLKSKVSAGGVGLEVTDEASSDFVVVPASSSGVCKIGPTAGAMSFQTAGTERARISSAGGFSVGTTADPGAGAIYATGNITAYYSDKRLKTVSGKIENALDKVGKLSGVYYTNNDTAKSFGYDSDEVQVGVIAQEVEAVLPQIVKAAPFDLDENNNSKSGENYKTVQYDKLVPLLIEAINELQAKVKALEAK
jgi:hypothetical protein